MTFPTKQSFRFPETARPTAAFYGLVGTHLASTYTHSLYIWVKNIISQMNRFSISNDRDIKHTIRNSNSNIQEYTEWIEGKKFCIEAIHSVREVENEKFLPMSCVMFGGEYHFCFNSFSFMIWRQKNIDDNAKHWMLWGRTREREKAWEWYWIGLEWNNAGLVFKEFITILKILD